MAPALSTALTWTVAGLPASGFVAALTASRTTPALRLTLLEGAEAGLEPRPLKAVTVNV